MAKTISETEKKAVKNSSLRIFVRRCAPETWLEWMWCDGMEILNNFVVVDEKGEEKNLSSMWSFNEYFIVDAELEGDLIRFRARHSWKTGYVIEYSLAKNKGVQSFERDTPAGRRNG